MKVNYAHSNCMHPNTMWTVDISQPPPLTQYDEWCMICGKNLKTEHSDYRKNDNAIGVDYSKSNLKDFFGSN